MVTEPSDDIQQLGDIPIHQLESVEQVDEGSQDLQLLDYDHRSGAKVSTKRKHKDHTYAANEQLANGVTKKKKRVSRRQAIRAMRTVLQWMRENPEEVTRDDVNLIKRLLRKCLRKKPKKHMKLRRQ